jgi:broad specificity phosphatase PhoE
MRIILLRHGKPNTPPLKKVSSAEFLEWVEEYNKSGLCQTSEPPAQVLEYIKECKAIVCSDLPRSVESAKALGVGDITLSDALFNEAGMPASNWRILKLSPKVWAVMYRVLWLMGYSNNSESFKEAKARAVLAVNKLTEMAHEHESVLFVGHGVYNRILANELRRSGWSGPKNPGSKHWSIGVYKCKKT